MAKLDPAVAELVALEGLNRKLTRKERKRKRKIEEELEKRVTEAMLEANAPFVADMREAGFDEAKIKMWLVRLLPIADQQALMTIAAPGEDVPVPVSASKRQLVIWRHQLSHWWNHRNPIVRLIYAGAWGTLLWGAVANSGLGVWGILTGSIVVVMKLRFVLGERDPKHMPLFQRSLNERNLILQTLLERLQSWRTTRPTADAVREFQRDALRMIASLVRDHRSDLEGKRVFVNLLIRDGDEVVVIARAATRPVPVRYTREECSIAWHAFEKGVPHMTGDLYAEEKGTALGKKYNSVLALPVKFRDEVIGVVSIDSELHHHFHSYFDDFQNLLGPYVQLIASSLLEDHDRPQLPPPTEGK